MATPVGSVALLPRSSLVRRRRQKRAFLLKDGILHISATSVLASSTLPRRPPHFSDVAPRRSWPTTRRVEGQGMSRPAVFSAIFGSRSRRQGLDVAALRTAQASPVY